MMFTYTHNTPHALYFLRFSSSALIQRRSRKIDSTVILAAMPPGRRSASFYRVIVMRYSFLLTLRALTVGFSSVLLLAHWCF